jgi:hypothetical protein
MQHSNAVSVGVIVHTPQQVQRLIRQKPLCWTWAVFASVLFQRWAALEQRKVTQVLAEPVTPDGVLLGGPDVAQFVMAHVHSAQTAMTRVAGLVTDTAFAQAFGAPDGEDAADAEAIVAAAHEVGDCYQQVLESAEECRTWLAPGEYADLHADCVQLVNRCLQELAGFVNDVLGHVEFLQRMAILGELPPRFQPLRPRLRLDTRLLASIAARLREVN